MNPKKKKAKTKRKVVKKKKEIKKVYLSKDDDGNIIAWKTPEDALMGSQDSHYEVGIIDELCSDVADYIDGGLKEGDVVAVHFTRIDDTGLKKCPCGRGYIKK